MERRKSGKETGKSQCDVYAEVKGHRQGSRFSEGDSHHQGSLILQRFGWNTSISCCVGLADLKISNGAHRNNGFPMVQSNSWVTSCPFIGLLGNFELEREGLIIADCKVRKETLTFQRIPLLILIRTRCQVAMKFYSMFIFALQENAAIFIAVTDRIKNKSNIWEEECILAYGHSS